MEERDNNMGAILGEIGCRFRSNIENHIKDYELQKGDDVEWLLEPLDAISHSPDIVLDAFQIGTKWESFYKLYFHNKNATQAYVPYDHPFESPSGFRKEGNTIYILEPDEIEEKPKPNPYIKTMLIKGSPEENLMSDVPDIWEDLIVPFTEDGIWQAVLLNETIALFPKGWHGNYLEKTYVFSREDMQQIIDGCKTKYSDFTDAEIERYKAYMRFLDQSPAVVDNMFKFRKADYERLVSFLDSEDIMPSVEINGDKAVVSYCYWNDWSGFCRASLPVERHGQSVSIGKTNKEVYIAYESRIMY